ncbi:hypothetical protein [Fodinicola acaciae]|uniref:hypothetical protein n=1 Tax=Fodinicola acaciae TaxID=2681555 RepID=UPI0013D7962E|nr:hypothetical protein [Fodinicola acaciae]
MIDLVLDRARTAARAGDLDRALQLLDGARLDNAGLDLLARVHAQRGDYDKADACWIRAGEPETAPGRAEIARIRAGRSARPFWQPGRVAVAGVVAAGLAVTGGVTWVNSLPAAPPDPRVVAAQSQMRSVQQQNAQEKAQKAAAAAALAAAVDRTAASLAVPGVQVLKHADWVEVRFTKGVFSYEDALTDEGTERLRQVGTKLRGLPAAVTVIGHAVPVAGGPQRGGSVLALARALVAARELARTSGRPLTAFVLTTGDQTANPFSTKAANRTVTLAVRPTAPARPS